MLKHSFTFGSTDVRKEFGVIVEGVDRPFFAKLRARKVVVPERDGAYDFGAKYRDELTLPIRCGTVSLLTQGAVRELVYALSQKSRLVLWDEPDKYYIGRLYDPGRISRIAGTMRKFTLNFVCDPFAYGAVDTLSIIGSEPERILYPGTAHTPTRVTIKNIGSTNAENIIIRIREKRSVY